MKEIIDFYSRNTSVESSNVRTCGGTARVEERPFGRVEDFGLRTLECLFRSNVVIHRDHKEIQGGDCRPRRRSWLRLPWLSPIRNSFELRGLYQARSRSRNSLSVCVFITAGPFTKLCVWGRRRVEDMCYEIRRAEACVD